MIEEAELLVESNSHPLQAFCDKVRACLGNGGTLRFIMGMSASMKSQSSLNPLGGVNM